MTKQQLLEAVRRVIKQELAEEMKTKSIPNPNAGKWRILNSKTESPLTDKFYDTKEEAGKAAKALGQINAPGIKIVQLKDTMKTFTKENAPTPSKPKETPGPAVAPGKPGQKPGPRRPLGNPDVKPKPKATMKEAEMLAQVVKRFKSKKINEEAEQKYSYGTSQPNKDQGDYTIIVKAYPDPNGKNTKDQLMAMVNKYKDDKRAPMQIKFFKSKKEAGK